MPMTKYVTIALFLIGVVIAVKKGVDLFKHSFEGSEEWERAKQLASRAHVVVGVIAAALLALLIIRLVGVLIHG
jgi:hypothetical protein